MVSSAEGPLPETPDEEEEDDDREVGGTILRKGGCGPITVDEGALPYVLEARPLPALVDEED